MDADAARLAELERRAAAAEQGVRDLQAWNHELAGRLTEFEQSLRDAWTAVSVASERGDRLEARAQAAEAAPEPADVGLELFAAGGARQVLGFSAAQGAAGEGAEYLAFENVFRRSEQEIRARQRAYLPLLAGREPVLDVGCGRGEMLELLREEGITASGIDLDPGMVARCREKGLDVTLADAVEHLRSVGDGALGTVFAAQVVEHLPYAALVMFLRLAATKLAPGGRLIAETVNPYSPGALRNFWLDPTHQHPLFPEVLLTLARAAGFSAAYATHPGATGEYQADRATAADYVVIAEAGSPAG